MKDSILAFLFRFGLGAIYRLLYQPKIVRPVKLPRTRAILVGNHTSYYDPITIGIFCNRFPHFMAKRELFTAPFGWFFKWLGLIKVDRDQPHKAFTEAKKVLESDHIILCFPEGTTRWKKPNELLPFKNGAIRLAKETGAPIIPFAIIGHPKLFHSSTTVIFGEPINVTDANDATNEILRNAVASLMQEINGEKINLIFGKPARNPSKCPPPSRKSGKI